MPARAAGLPSSTPRTSRPSRSGSPTDRRRRRATCDGRDATPSRGRARRLAAAERVDALAQRGVGRQGEVEALADPVRVEPDEPSLGVEQRAAGRARRERRGVLDAARDPPAARAAERARDRRHGPEGDARARRRGVAAAPKTAAPSGDAVAVAPLERRRAGGVDVDDGEVAVAVDAGDRADVAAAVGEGDGDLVAAQVVGVGEDACRRR